MLLFVIVVFALLLPLGTSLVLLRRYARQVREQARQYQQLRLETERLRKSEERHQLLFAANPYPMWIYDCETLRFVAVNESAVHTYGFTREEFLAMTLLDIRSPQDAPALLNVVGRRENGLNNPRVWCHRRKDGSSLFAEVKAFGFEEDGRKQELVLASDVTQYHLVEEALQQSQASLQSLVDNAPFGICRTSLEGDCCETLNSTLREMLGGYSVEEVVTAEDLETSLGGSQRPRPDDRNPAAELPASRASRPTFCGATEALYQCAFQVRSSKTLREPSTSKAMSRT